LTLSGGGVSAIDTQAKQKRIKTIPDISQTLLLIGHPPFPVVYRFILKRG
jgi:hypothetical protein